MAERASVRVPRGEIGLLRRGTGAAVLWAAVLSPVALWPAAIWLAFAHGEGSPFSLVPFAALLALAPFAGVITGVALRTVEMRHFGEAAVEDGALKVQRAVGSWERIPLSTLRAGYMSGWYHTPEVQFVLASGNVLRIRVRDTVQGEALLTAAGLDPSQRSVQATMRRRLHTVLFALFGVPAFAYGGAALGFGLADVLGTRNPDRAGTLALVPSLLLWLFVYLRVLATRVTVGAEGVRLTRGLGSRFVSFADVAHVEYAEGSVVFALKSGQVVRAWINGDGPPSPMAVADRIDKALERFQAGQSGGAAGAALLARGGRSLEAWRASLADALAREGTYRHAPVSVEDLRRVLADAAAGVEARVGAALALTARGDPDERARVRVAGEACLNEKVRAALVRVAVDTLDEGALEDALRAEAALSART